MVTENNESCKNKRFYDILKTTSIFLKKIKKIDV